MCIFALIVTFHRIINECCFAFCNETILHSHVFERGPRHTGNALCADGGGVLFEVRDATAGEVAHRDLTTPRKTVLYIEAAAKGNAAAAANGYTKVNPSLPRSLRSAGPHGAHLRPVREVAQYIRN